MILGGAGKGGNGKAVMKTNTVIIIDDNQMAVQALVKTTDWERLGCQVVGTASDGYEGLEKIREFLV